MLGFSLKPFPDELLYGLVARLYRIAGTPTLRTLAGRMFPPRAHTVGLPVDVGSFADWLADPRWSASRLAREHTHLPYYERFMSPAQWTMMRNRVLRLANAASRIVGFS